MYTTEKNVSNAPGIQSTGEPCANSQPALQRIIDRLTHILCLHEEIMSEMSGSLMAIKRKPAVESDTSMPGHVAVPPSCAVEELENIIIRFDNANKQALDNLHHLRDII